MAMSIVSGEKNFTKKPRFPRQFDDLIRVILREGAPPHRSPEGFLGVEKMQRPAAAKKNGIQYLEGYLNVPGI